MYLLLKVKTYYYKKGKQHSSSTLHRPAPKTTNFTFLYIYHKFILKLSFSCNTLNLMNVSGNPSVLLSPGFLCLLLQEGPIPLGLPHCNHSRTWIHQCAALTGDGISVSWIPPLSFIRFLSCCAGAHPQVIPWERVSFSRISVPEYVFISLSVLVVQKGISFSLIINSLQYFASLTSGFQGCCWEVWFRTLCLWLCSLRGF